MKELTILDLSRRINLWITVCTKVFRINAYIKTTLDSIKKIIDIMQLQQIIDPEYFLLDRLIIVDIKYRKGC